MKILLIRHGKTAGNLEKRYVGRTDEGLVSEAREEIRRAVQRGAVDRLFGEETLLAIYTSPMKRCLETAKLLFPPEKIRAGRYPVAGLSECDFGRFEYKNYQELSGDPDYQRFLDTGGAAGFPGGETTEGFKERTVTAFRRLLEDYREERDGILVFVVHGGTIMAVLEAFGQPKKSYYDWQVGNLGGYLSEVRFEKNGFRLEHIVEIGDLWYDDTRVK